MIVTWNLNTTSREEIKAIHVYRGANEETPNHAGTVAANATSFVDERAGIRIDAAWYRLVFEYEDGARQASGAVQSTWTIAAES